jgi:murein DD-endopeptidase MepM/ murein hydrolase activator NlpD
MSGVKDGRFSWPVRGRVVSRFGPTNDGLRNDGINISAPRGTAVLAAEEGTVAYAGNELRGFGNLVLIKHADGWMTTYAHLDQISVRRGERIQRGQILGSVGNTGTVTTPQLHFEVRKGTEAVNPQNHLRPG